MFERDADLVGGDLGEGGLVALAVRSLGGDDGDSAVGFDPYPGLLTAERAAVGAELGRPGCGLDERGEPEPEVAPGFSGGGLLLPERCHVDALGGSLEGL